MSKSRRTAVVSVRAAESSTVRAQAFYRKCGLVKAGEHSFALGTEAQSDHVMARSLVPEQ